MTAERWASQDRIAQERRDILGGVDNYVDPRSGQIVQLPVGWNSYWVNAQGEYLAVDVGSEDASQLLSQGWLELVADWLEPGRTGGGSSPPSRQCACQMCLCRSLARLSSSLSSSLGSCSQPIWSTSA